MSRKHLFLFCSLILSLPALAGPGFFRPEAKDAPAPVAQAAAAVYRYVARTVKPIKVFEKSEYAKAIADMSQGEFVERLIAVQVGDCQKQNQAQCPIHYAASGTAFVVGEKHDQLLTVSHNLAYDRADYTDYLGTSAGETVNIHAGADEETLARNMPMNFVLFDRSGKIAFDTERSGDYASPVVLGYGQMVDWRKDFFEEMPVDFVSIQLSRALGNQSLELRSTPVTAGETLSILGYPMKTSTRAYLESQPDSDGISQFYSSGAAIDPDTVFHFMIGPGYVRSEDAIKSAVRYFVYNDSEAVEGFSGSPVLDGEGKVVGILDAMWAVTDPRVYTPHNAIIIQTPWILENLKKYAP